MKVGTELTPKFKKLKRRLGLPLWQVKGLLESLWHVTLSSTPEGDIGRLSNEDIAATIEWDGDEDDLIHTLTETGWIDESDEYRLVIHDWHVHAPNYLKANFKKWGKSFCTGPSEQGAEQGAEQCAEQGAEQGALDVTHSREPIQSNPNQFKPSQSNPIQSSPDHANRNGRFASRERDRRVGFGEGLDSETREQAEHIAERIARVVPIRGDPSAQEAVCDVAIRVATGDVSRADLETALDAIRTKRPTKPLRYLMTCMANAVG